MQGDAFSFSFFCCFFVKVMASPEEGTTRGGAGLCRGVCVCVCVCVR